MLSGLYRLHCVNKLGDDGWNSIFGFSQPVASMACKLFYDFLTKSWSYLLLDNLDYWLPYLGPCRDAIFKKVTELDCEVDPLTFFYFAFVDNTMNGTCRPGGGTARDGTVLMLLEMTR